MNRLNLPDPAGSLCLLPVSDMVKPILQEGTLPPGAVCENIEPLCGTFKKRRWLWQPRCHFMSEPMHWTHNNMQEKGTRFACESAHVRFCYKDPPTIVLKVLCKCLQYLIASHTSSHCALHNDHQSKYVCCTENFHLRDQLLSLPYSLVQALPILQWV